MIVKLCTYRGPIADNPTLTMTHYVNLAHVPKISTFLAYWLYYMTFK